MKKTEFSSKKKCDEGDMNLNKIKYCIEDVHECFIFHLLVTKLKSIHAIEMLLLLQPLNTADTILFLLRCMCFGFAFFFIKNSIYFICLRANLTEF